jgi:hypothetical protein
MIWLSGEGPLGKTCRKKNRLTRRTRFGGMGDAQNSLKTFQESRARISSNLRGKQDQLHFGKTISAAPVNVAELLAIGLDTDGGVAGGRAGFRRRRARNR